MDAADLLAYEQVHVVDVNEGPRFETHVIEGERGSGEVCVNDAAARLVQPGDKVMLMSYASYQPSELALFEPRMVHVKEPNDHGLSR